MAEIKKLKLTFCGGVSAVTGANFLLESNDFKILVDCGLEQGTKYCAPKNASKFVYDPSTIDVLLVTHAHIDHTGRIPKLIKDGFKGKIYSTPETRRLAVVMLEDSMKLLEREALHEGKDPLYNADNVRETFNLWETIPYRTKTDIGNGFSVFLKDAGHVLGSSMIELSYNGKKMVFTGDLGNTPTPLLKDTEDITDADYLLMESVYGDRNHESKEERVSKLEDIIEDTVKRKGALIIPVFSLEKTQVILYELNHLIEQGRVPPISVFLDSPLAIKITEIYKEMAKDFNADAQSAIKKGDDIFNFPNLHLTTTSEESKKILEMPNPKIVMAGSGMSNGGRILHHELNYLGDEKNTLLLIGYQAAGTMGRQIVDGAKNITIFGNSVPVKAHIERIDGYSSHKDSDHLVEFVGKTQDTVKKVFVVMGETKSSMFLVQKLRDNMGISAFHPQEGESVELDF
jgi:metallo-beta-lactamase family protein